MIITVTTLLIMGKYYKKKNIIMSDESMFYSNMFSNPYVQVGLVGACTFAAVRLMNHFFSTARPDALNDFDNVDVIDLTHGAQLRSCVRLLKGAAYSIGYPFSKWLRQGTEYLIGKCRRERCNCGGPLGPLAPLATQLRQPTQSLLPRIIKVDE